MLKPHSLYVDPQKWPPAGTALWRDAANNTQVERLFVRRGIKKQLCGNVSEERQWFKKHCSYWWHHWHMHIRCQTGSCQCTNQQPVANEEDCGKSLSLWLSDGAWTKLILTNSKQVKPNALMVSDLPTACATLLTVQ